MTNNNWQKQIFRLSGVLCGVSFLLIVVTGYAYWSQRQQQEQKIEQLASAEATQAAQKIDQQLSQLKNNELSKGEIQQNKKIQQILRSLNLGKTGYAFILSQQGNFLVYPQSNSFKKNFHIFDYVSDTRLKPEIQTALQGQQVIIPWTNNLTGRQSLIIFKPIKSHDLILGFILIKEEFLDFQTLRRNLIFLSLELIIFGFFGSIIVFKAYQGTAYRLWLVSKTTTFLITSAIGFIWYLNFINNAFYEKNNVVLLTPEGVDDFLNSRHQSSIYIPTGVFIQTLDFQSANDVSVTGYIWQKYAQDIPQEISRGFVLPEAINDPTITLAYRRKIDDYEVIGWRFEANLRQKFEYSKYPFDDQQVWIRLWHEDFDKNVILTPDLDAYDLINPFTLPGIEQEDFVLPGWDMKASFFQYRLSSYNTNFGINNYSGQKDFPELYYTIYLQRDFLTIFVGNFLSPLVVACLLFFVQMLFIKSKENGEQVDFEALEMLSVCGAFLFILIIDQVSLRQRIITAGILYLEYFYFTLYLFILLEAINGILFVYGKNIKLIQYKNNLIPKLLYWPSIMTTLLFVTLFIFY